MQREPSDLNKAAAAAPAGPSAGRRALLRAGASSAPVLLTLASRPVAAADSCIVASSFVSVATFRSRNPATTSLTCSSRTAEDWSKLSTLPDSTTARTAGDARPAVLSQTVGQLLGNTTSIYNNLPLWKVLMNDSAGIVQTGELGVVQHLIAMTLNVMGGFAAAPGNVSVAYLQTVWSNYKSNLGYYRLKASGIDWDSAKVIAWLRLLMNPGTLPA